MTWGSWGKQLNTSEMVELMNHCLENGITTFDHADIYGDYSTESDFGKAFEESGINRSDVQIITKCGIQFASEKRPDNRIKHYNYNKDYIIWSAENSLKNLKTDHLDLFLIHRPSPLMQADEIAEAVAKLKADGKIKEFGVSNFTPSQTDLIQSKTEVSANQIEFSLTAFDAMWDGSLDHMSLNNITPMAWSPLGKVFREKDEQVKRINAVLDQFTKKYNASADQIVLAWTLNHPAGIHPVVGTTGKDRLVNALKAKDIKLELQDWFTLLEASTGNEVA